MTTSLVIPVYNGRHVLPRTVDAALAVGADETVYVDDGSSDGTGAWLADRLAAHPSARVVTHPVNRGRAAARNTGVATTSGGVLLFVDADLAPRPGYLGAHLNALRDPAAVATVGRVVAAEADLTEPYQRYFATYPRGAPSAGVADWRYFNTGLASVRRHAFDAAGGFDEGVRYGEDLALACALSRLAPRGLRSVPAAVGDVYDVSTLDEVLVKLEQFAGSLVVAAERCPEVYRTGRLEWLRSPRGTARMAAALVASRPLARAARWLLPRAPARWTPPVVRYLLAHTLASSLRDAPHPGPWP